MSAQFAPRAKWLSARAALCVSVVMAAAVPPPILASTSEFEYRYDSRGRLEAVVTTGRLTRVWRYETSDAGAMVERRPTFFGASVRILSSTEPLALGELVSIRLRVFSDPALVAREPARIVFSTAVRTASAVIEDPLGASSASVVCPEVGTQCTFDLPDRGRWFDLHLSLAPRTAGTLGVEVFGPFPPGTQVQRAYEVLGSGVWSDTDGDKMPDSWEQAHDLDPRYAPDAFADPDRDGRLNADEFGRGTDPRLHETALGLGLTHLARGGNKPGDRRSRRIALLMLLGALVSR